MDEPTKVEYPPITFICVETPTHVSDLPNVIPAGLNTVMTSNKGDMNGPPRVYYTDWAEGKGVAWIGFPVQPSASAGEGTVKKVIPGGKALVLRHTGPYNQLMRTWEAVMAAGSSTEHTMTGFAWEDYVDPGHQPGEEPKTDVYVQITDRTCGSE